MQRKYDCTFAGDHNILCLEKFSKRSYLCWNTCAGLSYHVHNLHDLMWWREPNLKAPAEIFAWVGETLLLLSQRQGFCLLQSTTIVLSHQWTISRSFSISPRMIYLMLYEAAKTLWSLVDVNEPRDSVGARICEEVASCRMCPGIACLVPAASPRTELGNDLR